MSACSPHPSSSSGLPPYSCPLGQDPAATDLSRLNPLVRTSSTAKGSFARIDSLASQFSFRGGGGGGKGGGDSELEELISLKLILAGKTKSPIGMMDLRGWLANGKRLARGEGDEEAGWLGDGEERRRREDEGALEFLVAFERYRTDFFALDLEDQLLSPTPFQLISLLSLSSHSHNKSSSSSSRNNNEPLPPLPPLKAPTSFRLPVTPTSSAGASSNPSTPQSAFSSSSTPSSSKQPQPMVYSLPPVARSRSGSAPPPLTLVPEGLLLAPRLPTVPDAVSFGDAASSDGRSVRSVASSKRTAGGLRGMGHRPLPRPHEEEESEEEDYDENEPENRSRSRSGSSRPSTKTRLRGMSGTSSSSSNGGSTIQPTQLYPTLPSTSRPRAATLPSSNASSSSNNPFQDPLTSTFTTVPLSPLPPSPLSSVPPTPPPHDYDEQPEATQPLREELNVLLSLAERLPKEFRVTNQMRREARMTTHPDVLSGLAGKVEVWAEKEWLVGRAGFLEDALENLDHRTALGRLLCGSFLSVLAVIAFFLLLLNPSPFRSDGKAVERPWRLIVVPMFLGGVGYAMGSRKSLCFWLALFGVREQKDYERAFELHPLPPPLNPSSTTTSRMKTSNSLSSRLARHGRQPSLSSVREVENEELPSPSSERRVPPHPLDFTSNPNLSFHTTQTLSPSSTSFFSSSFHSLAPSLSQRSLLSSHNSSKPKRARLPHLRRPSLPSSTRRTFWKLRLRLPKLPEIKIVWAPWFITLWRLTGTAWGTKRVEDERVLKAQRKAAWRIAGVLMAILAVLTVVVMVVPLIGKGREGKGRVEG